MRCFPLVLALSLPACGSKADDSATGSTDTDAPATVATGTGTGATTGPGTGAATGTGTGSGPDTCPAECDATIDTQQPPSVAVPEVDLRLAGRAWIEGGTLKAMLAPLIDSSDGSRIRDLVANDVTVTADGTELLVTSLYEVSELDPVPYDIVFVVDATDQMQWAVDGVRDGAVPFADNVAAIGGIDVRTGAVAFTDEVVGSVDLGPATAVRDWAAGITAGGGGDPADNALDAILHAVDTFSWRPEALRLVVLVIGEGMHECSVGCAETNLDTVVRRTAGNTVYAVAHTRRTIVPGVDPEKLVRGAGGDYVTLRGYDTNGFDVAGGTTFDAIPIETYTLTALNPPAGLREITVSVETRSGTVQAVLPIGG